MLNRSVAGPGEPRKFPRRFSCQVLSSPPKPVMHRASRTEAWLVHLMVARRAVPWTPSYSSGPRCDNYAVASDKLDVLRRERRVRYEF